MLIMLIAPKKSQFYLKFLMILFILNLMKPSPLSHYIKFFFSNQQV